MTVTRVLVDITVRTRDSVNQQHYVRRDFTALDQLMYRYRIRKNTSALEVGFSVVGMISSDD